LPDFSWYNVPNDENVPNDHKIYQNATKYTKWSENIPNGHKIYLHFPLQDPPKLTQIGVFGLKINHLATLVCDIFIFGTMPHFLSTHKAHEPLKLN
jgi:hypothetical protein